MKIILKKKNNNKYNLNVNLSKELRNKWKVRNIRVIKGDSCLVLKGSFKNKVYLIEKVFRDEQKVILKDTQREVGKKKVSRKISINNLRIIELNMTDPKREKRIK